MHGDKDLTEEKAKTTTPRTEAKTEKQAKTINKLKLGVINMLKKEYHKTLAKPQKEKYAKKEDKQDKKEDKQDKKEDMTEALPY